MATTERAEVVAPPLAETVRWSTPPGGSAAHRRDLVESIHRGHLVVVGPDGTVVGALGDPHRTTFVRSTAKPFQAAATLELIAEIDRGAADLPPDLLAITWASHRAELAHLETVRRLLARSGTDESELTTPPARPAADPSAGPSRIAHNCSGQHALFALAARVSGTPTAGVLPPSGPIQRHVLGALGRHVGPVEAVATDGCGAPTVAVPLVSVASAFHRLAGGGEADADRHLAAVVAAGHAHPHLVGGEGRLETELLGAGVVAKPGAEGIVAAGWRDRRGTWGVALRVDDGAARASSVALAALLRAVGVAVDDWRADPILGGGRPAGEVRATPDLSRLGERLREL